MRRTATRLTLLGLSLAAVGCQHRFAVPVHAPSVGPDETTFSWDGDPARDITVYRCAEHCPPPSSLPSYHEDSSPSLGEIVWDISAVGSPADGAGTIATPLVYGNAEHPKATVKTPAAELQPGEYLIRVVTFKGVQLKAHEGTGWSTFTIAGP